MWGAQMKLPRRRFLRLAAGAAALPAVTRIARAQTYPARPVRIVVGFAPGGSADIMTRLIGQWLSERLGQPMIIENRPGAGTNLAVQAVVNAPPDGYTLLSLTSSNAANVTLYENLPFDVRRDIVPIASIIRNALVLAVNPSLPFTSVADFIAHAKANPGKLSVASFGVGSTSHLAQELFCAMAGITVIHVPYRGDACLDRCDQRTESFCKLSQYSGLVPNQWPRRSAVSAVTPRSPFMISVIRLTGTSIWRANSAALIASSPSSSARCSPGWIGVRAIG
jgi:hypothetical protein